MPSNVLDGQGGPDTLHGGGDVDILWGGEDLDHLHGMEGNDILYGENGNDWLWGESGFDTMIGGLGDDYYIVGSQFDTITEALAAKEFDTVYTTVSCALPPGASIERLEASNQFLTTPINLTGNSYPNEITGNDGSNVINGGGDADDMAGRATMTCISSITPTIRSTRWAATAATRCMPA